MNHHYLPQFYLQRWANEDKRVQFKISAASQRPSLLVLQSSSIVTEEVEV